MLAVEQQSSNIFESSTAPIAGNTTSHPITPLRVPSDVVYKFDVESIDSTCVETLLKQKIAARTADAASQMGEEQEEAFYVIDLGCVLKKYQQWVRYLPRVKPFYGMCFYLARTISLTDLVSCQVQP